MPTRSFQANLPGAGHFRLSVDQGVICAIEPLGAELPDAPYCSAGFVDLQLNGLAGVDFSSATLEPDAVASIVPILWKTGVTSFCPTLLTNSQAALERNFRILEIARRAYRHFARCAPCYHLEGPYLSPGPSRGVHDPAWMRPPSWSEFEKLQCAADGNIGVLTLAPELPGAPQFIRRVADSGVLVAISHTDGTGEDVHHAAEVGAGMSTHLGNGCAQMLDRHRAPFWAQLAEDRLYASIICDTFHLSADLVRIIARVKGPDRTVLVTDSVHVAGLAPGRYDIAGRAIEALPTGQVVTADGRCMAGSTLRMDRAVVNFMALAGVPLDHALQAATVNPLRMLPCARQMGRIAVGEPADLVLFRLEGQHLKIEDVWLQGETVID